jgi:hypothetical protein
LRRHLDNLAADNVEPAQSAQQPLRLARRDAADFRRAGTGVYAGSMPSTSNDS